MPLKREPDMTKRPYRTTSLAARECPLRSALACQRDCAILCDMEEHQKSVSVWRKRLLLVLGIVFVSLGFVGALVPLLPTTPFLLLAAACFIRSSDRLYHWLMHNKWLGRYLYNYYHHRVMPLSTKITTLTLLWLTIGYTVVAVIDLLWVRGLLLVIAIGVTIHLALLPNRLPD